MRRSWTFTITSEIPAPPERVWARVVTPEGINHEMRPWMTMSMPPGARGMTIDSIPVGTGQPVGRAWIRLFGLVPFDFDHLVIARLEPGRRFVEESTMASMRRWGHDRTVAPGRAASSSQVTDVVTLEPRAPLRVAGPLLRRVLGAFFAHRHRRLAAYFADSRGEP
ncbi:hypothetical protein NCCP2495_30540 [Dietzia sp. NCCP-2495]|uniref:hypothetical protein n=1 Tax=Dietzia sp. NCCP-2495 TaxID=2934675 RepID=UPI002231B751|nr:hypothetical protein [Dietzia sp. NCCP-2495]GLB65174.1 hypothetical protein NCCP2495_30540 [Dietzia sp. NCCP-2495]